MKKNRDGGRASYCELKGERERAIYKTRKKLIFLSLFLSNWRGNEKVQKDYFSSV